MSHESPPKKEEQNPEEENSAIKKGLRNLGMAAMATLGMTAHEAQGAEHTALPNEDGHHIEVAAQAKDTTKSENAVDFYEKREIAGLTVEGMIPVISSDTTKEVFFIGFSGNEKTGNKIERIKKAIKELNLKPSDHFRLEDVYNLNPEVVKKVHYGMALGDNVNDGNIGFATFNQFRLNRYEQAAINSDGTFGDINFDDYVILVEKDKSKEGGDVVKK